MWCVVYAKKPYMDCLTYNNIDVYSKGEYMFYEKIELFVNVLKKFDIYILFKKQKPVRNVIINCTFNSTLKNYQ